MRLFAFIPKNTLQQRAFFVVAESFDQAKACVEKEIATCRALPITDPDHISDWEVFGWSTSGYRVEIRSAGQVASIGRWEK